MADAPRSNRPTPRSPAAIEAELRRRVRSELEQARAAADGELDDATLAGIIARAVVSALEWHLEAPEHTRNATLSSRSWRPAAGPRGGGGGFGDRSGRGFEDRPPRDRFEDQPERGGARQFGRGPRDFDRAPRDFDRRPRDFERGPRDFDRGARDFDRGPRDVEGDQDEFETARPPRPRGGGFKPRGGGGFKPRGGGGFKPRSGGSFKPRGGFKPGGFKPRGGFSPRRRAR